MTTLTQAHRQWKSRPDDERFTSLIELRDAKQALQSRSARKIVSSRVLTVQPTASDPVNALELVGQNGVPASPTHHSFGQLATLAGAPAGYMRALPAPIAADCINYGLRFHRNVDDIGLLLSRSEDGADISLRAATGPNYGRIWDADVATALVDRFGDGVSGAWRVPGEFGRDVPITKANTTLYASDRDMWVFLADENNRVEIPNRRHGESGTLARGFFVWNSEVGARTLGIAMFLFDYVCANRIIWGASDYREIKLRHSSGAPDRWLGEIDPILDQYRHGSARLVQETIEAARAKKVSDDLTDFLANRFGSRGIADQIEAAHLADEGRPIETLWDVTVGATAYARTIEHQDRRIEIERAAGKVMALAA